MIGPERWVGGNEAIPLDAGSAPSRVVSGSLAVFGVDNDTGERLHLFSVKARDPLMPVAIPPGAAWEIAAVPLEESCLGDIRNLPDWERVFVQENWLALLGLCLAQFRPAGDALLFPAGRSLLLKPGQRAAVANGLVFVRTDECAGEKVCASIQGAPVGVGETFALTPGLWLEATFESEWQVTTGDSAAVDRTIALATRVLFDVLNDLKTNRETADRDRFFARQELNERASQLALGDLAGIAGQKSAGTRPERTADPLFDAFRAAAAALGVSARIARGNGPRADAIREIAQASGIRTRTVVLSGKWWLKESAAMVTHRDTGEPVALIPVRKGYRIYDPLAGNTRKVDATSAATLNAFAQMLYQPLPADVSTRNLLRQALGSRRSDLRKIVAAGLAAAALGIAGAQGFAILIGQAIPDADRDMVWQVGAGLASAALGSAIFLLAQAVAILRLQSAAFVTLQAGVWDYLLNLSPAFFRSFTAGQLRVRADAVTRIHQLLTADALRSLATGAASVVGLLLILWYSPALALLALVAGAAIALYGWLGARTLFRVQGQWQEMEELLSGLVLQSINAVSKLRVAGAGSRAFSQWAREYSRMQKLSFAVQTRKDRIRLFNLVIPTLATALAFLYLLQQSVATGSFLACMAAMTVFLTAVTSASESISGLVLVANKWQQMLTILEAKPETDGSKIHPGRLSGAVSVQSLTFRYRSDGPMILDGVSIQAEPGECIALTGPSGSGKTTLINLLLRFETPHSGAVYLDGRELSGLDVTAVRRQIGVVTQDGRIIAGSLFENICSSGLSTMEEAWEAARDAGLAEDIEAMPMGMHTVVSEGGGNLSGGQRQRLLIARALILKPAILIFDEATSALDNRTQAIVTESLNRLRATRILVAHRLSTIRHADRIYVIDKGKVIQQGKFDELAAAPGLFARLAERQTA